ncbi:MAG: zinc ribbon domain-containing protein [bacterium]
MPTYEYECVKCKFIFEEFQKITDKPIKTCPKCKGDVKRVFTPGAGFLFKGSGFHTTDYRSKNYVEAEKRDSGYKEPKPEKSTGHKKEKSHNDKK